LLTSIGTPPGDLPKKITIADAKSGGWDYGKSHWEKEVAFIKGDKAHRTTLSTAFSLWLGKEKHETKLRFGDNK
jgi:hypothetical protein